MTTTPILQEFLQNFVEPFPSRSLTLPWSPQSQTSDRTFVVEPLLRRFQPDNFKAFRFNLSMECISVLSNLNFRKIWKSLSVRPNIKSSRHETTNWKSTPHRIQACLTKNRYYSLRSDPLGCRVVPCCSLIWSNHYLRNRPSWTCCWDFPTSTSDFLEYKHLPDRPTADGHESIKADNTWHQVSHLQLIYWDPLRSIFLVFHSCPFVFIIYALWFPRLPKNFAVKTLNSSCLNEVVSQYAAVAQCPQSAKQMAKSHWKNWDSQIPWAKF